MSRVLIGIFYCRSKGFGFVTFNSTSSIDEIQKNRPHEIDGKKIETKRATPKQVSVVNFTSVNT